jgi:O-methyltransferase involved in polyketide biosynthesis
MAEAPLVPEGVDPTVPSPARLYDYYLGGTLNYEVDRAAGERLRANYPEITQAAWANRGFHQRAARYIVDQGIRQFVDVGSGLPTIGNTHDVVQREDSSTRVVYVDQDPMVELYSHNLLEGQETVGVILGDMRRPDEILNHPLIRELIDFDKPVGLLMTAVWHFVSPNARPYDLFKQYLDALAPGSYVALSHITADRIPPRVVDTITDLYANATEMAYFRDKQEFARFFDGLELVPAYEGTTEGVVTVGLWGAEDPVAADGEDSRLLYSAVARKPLRVREPGVDRGEPAALVRLGGEARAEGVARELG